MFENGKRLAVIAIVLSLSAGRAVAGAPMGQPMRSSRVDNRVRQRLTQAREDEEESEIRRLTPVVRRRSVAIVEPRTRAVTGDASRELKTRRVVATQ